MQDTGDLTAHSPRHLDQEFYQDPHGLYERLREEGPVRPVVMPDGRSGWLVTAYDDARALLADPRLRKEAGGLVKLLPPAWKGRSSRRCWRTCSSPTRPITPGFAAW